MNRTLKNIVCLSVVGGWQSAFFGTEITFGPVSNSVADLWRWQSQNIYQPESDTVSA